MNENFTCYRNAFLVVLLHSNRFISWIRERYIHSLLDAGLVIRPDIEPEIDRILGIANAQSRGPVSKYDHSDVWSELYQLMLVYFSPVPSTQAQVNEAMQLFWEYITHPKHSTEMDIQNLFEKSPATEDSSDEDSSVQQDPTELFNWITGLSRQQRGRLIDRVLASMDAEWTSKVMEVPSIDELTHVSLSVSTLCVECGRKRNIRRRLRGVDMNYWNVHLPSPDPVNKEVITLEELLKKGMKTECESYLCPACKTHFDAQCGKRRDLARTKDEKKCAEDWIVQENARFQQKKTYEWARVYRLPEVLILGFNRVGTEEAGETRKNEVPVKFGESLDLSPFLDKKLPAGTPSKYRLMGIVSHRSSRSGNEKSGHYKAHVNFDGWHTFDDETVKRTRFKSIQKAQTENHPWTPYILLYEKVIEDSAGVSNQGDGKTNAKDHRTENDETPGQAEDAKANQEEDNAGTADGHGEIQDQENPVVDIEEHEREDSHGNIEEPPKGDGGTKNDDDVGRTGDKRCPQCRCKCECPPPATALPTWNHTAVMSQPHQPRSLQVTTASEPRPGQLFIKASANVNGYKISFPTYVLEGYMPLVNGGQCADVTLELSDHHGQSALIKGSALINRRPVRSSAPPETNWLATTPGKRKWIWDVDGEDDFEVTPVPKRPRTGKGGKEAEEEDGAQGSNSAAAGGSTDGPQGEEDESYDDNEFDNDFDNEFDSEFDNEDERVEWYFTHFGVDISTPTDSGPETQGYPVAASKSKPHH